jgi:LacI family transcriptional regulator/LacI family repressor for deo operon, udp, cdd, tsx, nupC, and nupG
MMVTIKDIARIAGVSHTTVSRALKNNPAISPGTTRRIQRIASELGYTPSAVAQSLLSQQTWTIGVVVTSIADPFVAQVVEGVEMVAQAASYGVFLITSNNNLEQEIAAVETLQRRRVDAIIVTSSRVGNLYSSRLNQIRVPIVLINNQEEGEYLYSVAVDDVQGAQLAVEHLLGLGHRRIGYIGAPNRPKSNKRRLAGYQNALLQAGIEPDPALIIHSEVVTDVARGQASLARCLAAGATAVFCYNDLTAIGLLMACHQQQLRVPEQLSVVGFDGIEAALYVTPAITTINQPRLRLGEIAMEMTLALLKKQHVQDCLLPCQLTLRESTARYKNDA